MSPGGQERSSGLGSSACARFRLGSPRFHEPEDHADVGDSLIGQRRWQPGQEIPVVSQVRAHAGGQRHAGLVTTVGKGGAHHRRDVLGEVAEQRHVVIGQGLTDGELADQSVIPTAIGRDRSHRVPPRITQPPAKLFQKPTAGVRAVFPARGWLPVGITTATSAVSEKSLRLVQQDAGRERDIAECRVALRRRHRRLGRADDGQAA